MEPSTRENTLFNYSRELLSACADTPFLSAVSMTGFRFVRFIPTPDGFPPSTSPPHFPTNPFTSTLSFWLSLMIVQFFSKSLVIAVPLSQRFPFL